MPRGPTSRQNVQTNRGDRDDRELRGTAAAT
jgi:hypothetical protein